MLDFGQAMIQKDGVFGNLITNFMKAKEKLVIWHATLKMVSLEIFNISESMHLVFWVYMETKEI